MSQSWQSFAQGLLWHVEGRFWWIGIVSVLGYAARKYQMRVSKEQRRFLNAATAAYSVFSPVGVPTPVEELVDRQSYRWAEVTILVNDVYVKLSLEDGLYAYELADRANGPWIGLNRLLAVRRSFGETDGPAQGPEFLQTHARAHVENWGAVHDALFRAASVA